MTAKERDAYERTLTALHLCFEIAHKAANGAHRRPGRSEPVSALKADLRRIRDVAAEGMDR